MPEPSTTGMEPDSAVTSGTASVVPAWNVCDAVESAASTLPNFSVAESFTVTGGWAVLCCVLLTRNVPLPEIVHVGV